MKTERPDARWEAFARREPWFAVFTNPKFLRANLTPENEREFFDSGERLVDSIIHVVTQRLAREFAPESVAEFGCGVGRLAIPFARRAGSVTAVDRSPAMLDAAGAAAAKQAVANIRFQTDGEFFATQRKFDLVNCYLVFQRLPRTEGLTLFRELLGRIGAGGIGVFHFPYRSDARALVAAARGLRERSTIINGALNLARHKRFADPFIASHTYDLDEVFAIVGAAGFHETHVVFEQHDSLGGALLFVRAPASFTATDAPDAEAVMATQTDDAMIDVRELIARTSIDDLNRTAEEYFAGLTDWEHHLSKPFSKPDEAPALLANVAVMLQGLRLTAGMTVLEFGAGTGWLSRFLTQLGCRVILLDVSPTALAMARALYERLPPIGDRPAPEFLAYDGRRIALPDASVERVLSFDAFHHATNPDDVLREFARVLTPGGIAAFAEPGPRHSRTPLSQFEMRTYGVVENDIDIHAIWRTAQECGFRDLKLAAYHTQPHHLSLDEYEDLLAGGPAAAAWVAATRNFLRDVRSFFLYRDGAERIDSRATNGLASDVMVSLPTHITAGEPIAIDATVTNRGAAIWLASHEPYGGVALGAHLYDGDGKLITFDVHWQQLTEPPREIGPGETVTVRFALPPLDAGRYVLEFDCVAARVSWFAPLGSKPARVALEVAVRDV